MRSAVSFGPSTPGSSAKVGAPCETNSAGASFMLRGFHGFHGLSVLQLRMEAPPGIFKAAGVALRPLGLTRLIGDEILADLNLHMQQEARLGVVRDGVVGLVADEIRLAVRDPQMRLPPPHLQHP